MWVNSTPPLISSTHRLGTEERGREREGGEHQAAGQVQGSPAQMSDITGGLNIAIMTVPWTESTNSGQMYCP